MSESLRLNKINTLYYAIATLYAININVVTGLYFYDILIFITLAKLFYIKKLTVSINVKYFIFSVLFLITFPTFISLLYQIFFYPDLTQKYSIYIAYNTFILIMYILFFENTYKETDLNFNIIVSILFIPIFISLIMYFDESINSFFTSLYNIGKQHSQRYAGIWGRDVNQLGYYATLYLFFNICLYHYKKISKHLFVIFVTFSLVAIIISGMRLGIFVLGTLLIAFAVLYKNPVLSLKSLTKYTLLLLLLGVAYSLVVENGYIVKYLMQRFDINLFFSDLTGSSGRGHVGKMYAKWYEIFTQKDDLYDTLLGMYPKWKFPDSLVIFYFANHGLIGVMFLVLFIGVMLKMLYKFNFPYIPTFILFFSIIVSFKGNFIFNNMGMFLFTFIIYIFLYQKYYGKNSNISVSRLKE